MSINLVTSRASYILSGFFIVAILLGSCKKDTNGDSIKDVENYAISFKANGVLQEFISTHFPIGSFYDNGTQYQGLFTGTRSASQVGVQVYDKKMITESTYTGYIVTQATTESLAFVIGAAVSYRDGPIIYQTGYDNPDVTIRITKITATTVRGTFSCTLKSAGKPDLVITEGKFFVPLGNIPA